VTRPFLSIIIPAYNEATRLPPTLADIERYLGRADFTAEVIVVNDGSIDETATIAGSICAARTGWRLIDAPVNEGKGAAVRRGMLAATGEWRLFMDADNSTALCELDAMRPRMRDDAILIGSRAVDGAELDPPQPFVRRWAGKAGNLIIQAAVLRGIWDSQCGFKVFPANAASRIFPLVETHGWGFDVEVIALARRLGFRILELPVRWVNHPSSRVGWRGYFSTLRDVARIRMRLSRLES
jgi:dolichyl-phosphate beta-glucosyltransferase